MYAQAQTHTFLATTTLSQFPQFNWENKQQHETHPHRISREQEATATANVNKWISLLRIRHMRLNVCYTKLSKQKVWRQSKHYQFFYYTLAAVIHSFSLVEDEIHGVWVNWLNLFSGCGGNIRWWYRFKGFLLKTFIKGAMSAAHFRPFYRILLTHLQVVE